MSLIQIDWLYLKHLQQFTHIHKTTYFKTNLKAHLKRTKFTKNVVLFLANLYLYYLFWAKKMSLKHWKLKKKEKEKEKEKNGVFKAFTRIYTHTQNDFFKTNLKAHLKRTKFTKNFVLFLANLYLYYLFWARKMSLKHWKLKKD